MIRVGPLTCGRRNGVPAMLDMICMGNIPPGHIMVFPTTDGIMTWGILGFGAPGGGLAGAVLGTADNTVGLLMLLTILKLLRVRCM